MDIVEHCTYSRRVLTLSLYEAGMGGRGGVKEGGKFAMIRPQLLSCQLANFLRQLQTDTFRPSGGHK